MSYGAEDLRGAVAPHAGARIETHTRKGLAHEQQCRPPRGGADRNFKARSARDAIGCRPPRGGADRNSNIPTLYLTPTSRPPRGGADRNGFADEIAGGARESPPTRGRGSKRQAPRHARRARAVAPHAGARIETFVRVLGATPARGRPPRGGADRNQSIFDAIVAHRCRPPRGGADRNATYTATR